MTRVLCILDDTPFSSRVFDAALERARGREGELALVGVVSPGADAPSPASGERIRRFGLVQANLARAARKARLAGLPARIALREGDVRAEALAAADELSADEMVLAERGRVLRRSDVAVVALARGEERKRAPQLVAA